MVAGELNQTAQPKQRIPNKVVIGLLRYCVVAKKPGPSESGIWESGKAIGNLFKQYSSNGTAIKQRSSNDRIGVYYCCITVVLLYHYFIITVVAL